MMFPIFPTCCTVGSNPLISLPPQERTTSANNQPWTPHRLRGSPRCKRHAERYTVFQLLPLRLCHEYFIRQSSQSCSCLPGWKAGEERRVACGWGLGCFGCCVVGNGVGPVSSAHLIGNMLAHILSLSETLVCIPVAQLSKVFFCGFFWSCLTLLTTHRLVVQPVQICFEYFLLPCWISRPSCLIWRDATWATCSPRITWCLFCDDSQYECVWNTCEHASLCGIVSDHAVTFSLAVISTVFCPFFNTLSPLTLLFFLSFWLPLPSLFHVPALQQSLGRPCFSNFFSVWNKTGRETREKCKAVKQGWEEVKRRWMQNRLRDGGREGAKTVPEQGNGELV